MLIIIIEKTANGDDINIMLIIFVMPTIIIFKRTFSDNDEE